MSPFIQYMLDNGVPKETLILLLMLPIVATVIVIVSQLIGLKGFGLYMPLIVSFAFVETTLKYGVAVFVTVLVVGTILRLIIKKARLLYLPRIAIVTSVVAVVMMLLFWEGAYSQRTGLISVSIFPLLIMITLVERFVAAQIESGWRPAITLTIATLLMSIISFYLIMWPWLRGMVVQYPWAILITLVVNMFLGRYTGLRLTEYFRFRDVIKHAELPAKK